MAKRIVFLVLLGLVLAGCEHRSALGHTLGDIVGGILGTLFTIILGLLAIPAIIVGASYGVGRMREENRRLELTEAQERQLKQQRINEETARIATQTHRERLLEEYQRPLITADEFAARFSEDLRTALGDKTLPQPLLDGITDAARQLFAKELNKQPKFGRTNQDGHFIHLEEAVEWLRKFDPAIIQTTLRDALLPFARRVPINTGPFNIAVKNLIDVNTTVTAMSAPFWQPLVAARNVLPEIRNYQSAGHSKTGKWAPDYKGDDAHTIYFPKEISDLFELTVPWGLSAEDRHAHHWVLGHTKQGKSTFLRHLLKTDLEQVIAGECSLFVMDSKKLAREMMRLKIFAPGQPLYGKLIIVDPTPEYAVALNPFHLGASQNRDTQVTNISELVEYMFADLTSSSAGSGSDLQSGALKWMARAACSIPNPSLDTIRDFFMPLKKGEVAFGEYYDRFDPDTRFWLEHNVLHDATRKSLFQRVMNLRLNQPIMRMLNAPEGTVDLYDELHEGGKVVLVDTDQDALTADGTNLLGRMFIKLLDRMATRRQKFDEHSLKPVWCHIDEAQDYIRLDETFANVLEKARSARVCFTVAHQNAGQIEAARTRGALSGAELRTECPTRGLVQIEQGHKQFTRRYNVPVRRYEFLSDEPQMTNGEYHQIRQEIFAKYGPKTFRLRIVGDSHDYDRP